MSITHPTTIEIFLKTTNISEEATTNGEISGRQRDSFSQLGRICFELYLGDANVLGSFQRMLTCHCFGKQGVMHRGKVPSPG
jgi:hypothetical protein